MTKIYRTVFHPSNIHAGTEGDDVNLGGLWWSSLYRGSPGADMFFDDSGYYFDAVDYAASPEAVLIDQRFGVGRGGHAEGDRYEGIDGFIGSAFDDVFHGEMYWRGMFDHSWAAEFFFGGPGDDVAYGYGGEDVLRGGDGNDTLDGGEQADLLDGGNGDDRLFGDDWIDTLYGRYGDDHLDGGVRDDTLHGNDGDDTLTGGLNEDALYGGNGYDVLWGDLVTGPGPSSGAFHDDDDRLYGGGGNDVLHGGGARDALYGDAGADRLFGGTDGDQLYGGEGFDRVDGGAGDDWAWLGDGGDTYLARDASGAGADRVFGEAGGDFLHGGRDGDALDGGAGDDVLDGGFGDDALTGGAGADAFHFRVGSGRDAIADFAFDEGDRMHVSSAIGVGGVWIEGGGAFIGLGDGAVELRGVEAAELALIAANIEAL